MIGEPTAGLAQRRRAGKPCRRFRQRGTVIVCRRPVRMGMPMDRTRHRRSVPAVVVMRVEIVVSLERSVDRESGIQRRGGEHGEDREQDCRRAELGAHQLPHSDGQWRGFTSRPGPASRR